MYCSTAAIQESVVFSSDTATTAASGQRYASGSAADAGSRNLALSNEVRLRGCTKGSLPVSRCGPPPLRQSCRAATSPTEGRLWQSPQSERFRQRLPYKGQRRRPPPAAEAGRSCWGSGQRYASGSEADAGSRNPALSNEVRLRGCMKARLPSRCSRDGEAIPSPALLPSATGSHPSAQHNKQTKTPPTVQKPSAAFCLFSQQRSMDQALASLLCSAFL